ncbi:biotin--[acetyl-CoA-carboxylase] ligase [Komagataeibacter sp. AV436]|uniref:biotin--[biotin carboxyl-carrier protein] ligase n=1 Tax=Komagataeibacter melomenusus TaxID=2766578 RepID=A0ABX2AFM2_9PROT|nr:biotin--[acetyl-CoA-carboxylase] ligase [Komagataeibacter melomenusus]MBV1830921.1 biotin--[acetyl-CoA-carboxylase] ligase [Komagataeibacter melomenusus]NPC67169.1 biotin--[acetyl-CoA-carboxylase] ligase [Komagataeibacter melomenusus]
MTHSPSAFRTMSIPRSGGRAWPLQVHDRLGSTSDLCKDMLAAGQGRDGLAVLALEQTAGRGSRGREWRDPGGNLALSVMLAGQGAFVPVGLWPFIAGLALHDAVAGFMPEPGALELKWPNDLLLHGRKMAGILIETGSSEAGPWQVIGIGANLAAAPRIEGRELACLAECGVTVSPPDMARAVLCALDAWLECHEAGGFGAIRAAWLARAHPPGTKLHVVAGNRAFSGTFAGLADDGILLLDTPAGPRQVVTGEVLMAGGRQE